METLKKLVEQQQQESAAASKASSVSGDSSTPSSSCKITRKLGEDYWSDDDEFDLDEYLQDGIKSMKENHPQQ